LKRDISFCPFMYNIIRLGDQHPLIWGETSMNFKSSKIRWVMALTFALVVALAVIITVTSKQGIVRATASSSGATIASDQADYMPGATVTLTGAGWASGEAVHIYVNDSVGNTWSLNSGQNGAAPDPIADTSGGFTYSFALPNYFVANYSATATGATSGTATTTFTDAPCPGGGIANRLTDNQVGASYTTSGDMATYTFSSFVNENPSGGVPGLIDYCVYTKPLPDKHFTAVSNWGDFNGTDNFSFGRKTGSDNIPLDGTTGIEIGTATWNAGVPTSQTIVLHVDDAAECQALYGAGSSNTCFVLPGTRQAKNPTVKKDATPSFTRTFTWGIMKDVNKNEIDIADGSSATFNYTVSVTHNSGTDGNWKVTGNIDVSNGNPNDSVTLKSIDDSVNDPNATCTVDTSGGLSVKPGDTLFPYKCTYTQAPASSTETNTVTINWDKQVLPNDGDLAAGSASGTKSVDFSTPTTIVDGSVTVTDTLGGSLGTVSYTDSSPKTITYSHTFSGDPAGTCTSHGNTASFKTSDTGTTGSANQTVKVCVGADLTVSKIANPSFMRTFKWGISKSVDKTEIDIAQGGSATFTYTVSVTHDSGTDSNWAVSGMITVKNPNDWEAITLTGVTDAVDNGGNCTVSGDTAAKIDASGSVTLTYNCTYSSAPTSSSGTNTATANWDKTAASTPDGSATGSATFAFTIPTTVVDGSVTVTDTFKGDLGTVSYTDPSPTTFSYSRTESGSPGTCTGYANTATFTTKNTNTTGSDSKTVKVCVGVDLTVSKTANPSFTRTFKWGITKSVDQTQQNIPAGGAATFTYTVEVTHDAGTDSGWTVSGTITVNNPNEWEAITADVSDAVNNDPNASCVVTGGTNLTLAAKGNAGDTVTLPYTCTYSAAPASNSETNTATATWNSATFFTPDGSAQGSAKFDFTTPTTVVDGSVTVTDTLGGPLGTVSYTDPSPTTFPYPYTFSGDPGGTCTSHGNTASFKTSDTDTTGSASQTVKVCVGADLTVSKNANTGYVLTYGWGIKKSVDKTLVEQVGGGTATFNYTVEVTHDNGTESGWTTTGTITVSNPNDFEDVTGVKVTDVIDNGGTCTVTGGTNLTVPAGQSVTLSYSCTYGSAPSPRSGTNTATASWDKTAASTPDGSAQGTASADFNNATVTVDNGIITVVDDKTNPANPVTLGTVGYTDPSPKDFTYALTLNVPTTNCAKYTNTAKIVETKQTASQTVEVCGPAKTGALTMGYWQNKNGQGIISATNQANLGTWLKGYHPFSDAPSSGLATYVYNIIKAANCSGTTCNTMLRAQMLATALDVYFSDPALGGNKINAPAPIGGVTIDLTKICQMIDGSGTGTCSSTYENVSGAFGGATSLTVLQMLTYQNTADPLADAGAVWYSQVKATQVLAKDAFDAINNQVVFAP